jgi:hypothetical protein
MKRLLPILSVITWAIASHPRNPVDSGSKLSPCLRAPPPGFEPNPRTTDGHAIETSSIGPIAQYNSRLRIYCSVYVVFTHVAAGGKRIGSLCPCGAAALQCKLPGPLLLIKYQGYHQLEHLCAKHLQHVSR